MTPYRRRRGDDAVRLLLCDKLDDHGYRPVVVDPGTPIDELAARIQPVAILLDLDCGDGHGLAVVARIREHTAIPVIVLSALAAEGDKVTALDAGADDYVTKPFGATELMARLRVALRHARTRPPGDELLEVGPIRIDTVRTLVTVRGKLIHLTPVEFRLLAMLARLRGTVVTRKQLAHEV